MLRAYQDQSLEVECFHVLGLGGPRDLRLGIACGFGWRPWEIDFGSKVTVFFRAWAAEA